MESLKTLIFKENPLSPEEQEIARNDTETIKDYCRQRASIAIMLIYTDICKLGKKHTSFYALT